MEKKMNSFSFPPSSFPKEGVNQKGLKVWHPFLAGVVYYVCLSCKVI